MSPFEKQPSSVAARSRSAAARPREPTAGLTVGEQFSAELHAAGMCAALRLLNARTRFRFTGIYRAEPPLLRNEYLFDRENPLLSLGGDVCQLENTYCGIVVATGAAFESGNARADVRLATHPARQCVVSYIGIPVRSPDGRMFGTLCHFDLRPRLLPRGETAVLETISVQLSDWLHQERPAS